MDEVVPGIRHWTAFDAGFRQRVSSHYVEPAGILIDPMVPEEGGIDALAGLPVRPQQIVLTNHHHRRDSSAIAAALDCPIRVHAKGLAALADEPRARRYEFGDEVAPGVFAIEVGKLAPDETALWIVHERGAMTFGDALIRPAGALGFFGPDILGAHPQRVQAGLVDAFRGLLMRDFDALLFAHGEPMARGGKTALRELTERPVGQPEYGPVL
jgi:hypothetical protein